MFPNYLKTIYKASPEEIIANWNSLKSKVGVDTALVQVKAKPEILNPKLLGIGSLKGTGLGTVFGLDGARTGAILNAKVLEERFAKYESSFVMEEKARTELASKDLERIEAEAIMVRAKLQQELPSKLEASLIEATAKAVARRSTKAITELASSQEAIARTV